MTIEPESISGQVSPEDPPKKKFELSQIAVLEDLFYLGFSKSEKMIVYKDEVKNLEINVVFRTLTPSEHRDIWESLSKFSSFGAQAITEKMEILSRAIVTLNDMPLVLDNKDKEEFNKRFSRDPSPLDQARFIIIEKIKSKELIDLLYEAYEAFSKNIIKNFDDIKKKLKNPSPSEST